LGHGGWRASSRSWFLFAHFDTNNVHNLAKTGHDAIESLRIPENLHSDMHVRISDVPSHRQRLNGDGRTMKKHDRSASNRDDFPPRSRGVRSFSIR
jgi:hypothetical protein